MYFGRAFKYLYIINLFVVIVLFFYKNAMPIFNSTLNKSLILEPLQTVTAKRPFFVSTPDMKFYIEPVFNYKIYGLVVSKYNARQNFIARIDRKLNVTDLCVIWGSSAFNQSYKDWTFWSGSWTCFGKPKTNEAYDNWRNHTPKGFNWDELSNNHLLTENSILAEQLKGVNIGDQIYIEGYLANYGASPQKIYRRTSVTRTDTGNGACETIYVTKFELLSENSYRKAFNYSLYLLIAMTVGFFIGYYWYYHKKPDQDI